MSIEQAYEDAAKLRRDAQEFQRQASALILKADQLEEFITKYGKHVPPLESMAHIVTDSESPPLAVPEKKQAEAGQKRARLTQEQIDQILSQSAAKVKMADIARNVGVSIATVNNYVQKHRKETNGTTGGSMPYGEPALPNMLDAS